MYSRQMNLSNHENSNTNKHRSSTYTGRVNCPGRLRYMDEFMNRADIDTQLSKAQRVLPVVSDAMGKVFTSTIEVNRFDAEMLVAHLESDLRVWEGMTSDIAKARVQLLRYYHRQVIELIHGVKNSTDPITQVNIDQA